MDLVQTVALTMGAAWASGINLYAAILMLGLMGATGHVVLPADLAPLTHPLVIGAAGFMYCVEFFADKVPGVDTGWDALHTFLRIPAGAALAAGAVGDVSVVAQVAAALVGGTLAAGVHATKAGARVMINTSPEPVSNWVASLSEDVAVFGGLWVCLNYPWAFVALLAVFVLVMAWLLPRIWRGVMVLARTVGRWLGMVGEEKAPVG
ncbi:MAG: DUF4126 domain-containing protein [Chromatiales bacterium]|nr:DUF4126 domain-containing protein [Chromatiales bacterium]